MARGPEPTADPVPWPKTVMSHKPAARRGPLSAIGLHYDAFILAYLIGRDSPGHVYKTWRWVPEGGGAMGRDPLTRIPRDRPHDEQPDIRDLTRIEAPLIRRQLATQPLKATPEQPPP